MDCRSERSNTTTASGWESTRTRICHSPSSWTAPFESASARKGGRSRRLAIGVRPFGVEHSNEFAPTCTRLISVTVARSWYDRLDEHVPGFRSHVSFMPDRGVGVIVLTNASGAGSTLADAVATSVYDVLFFPSRTSKDDSTLWSQPSGNPRSVSENSRRESLRTAVRARSRFRIR